MLIEGKADAVLAASIFHFQQLGSAGESFSRVEGHPVRKERRKEKLAIPPEYWRNDRMSFIDKLKFNVTVDSRHRPGRVGRRVSDDGLDEPSFFCGQRSKLARRTSGAGRDRSSG